MPAYTAEIYSSGTKLAFAISNQTNYGTNIPDQETFIIEIRNAANSILYSYSVDGNSGSAPVTYITPSDIGGTWDNVRIQMIAPSHAPNGDSCDTETYETPEPYTLTNITISWFDGTTIPACLGISGSDTEIVKKNKMMSKICAAYTASQTNTSDITTINSTLGSLPVVDGKTDITSSCTLNAALTGTLLVYQWNDGTIEVMLSGGYAANIPTGTTIIDGLPLSNAVVRPVTAYLTGASLTYQNVIFNGLNGKLKVDGTNLIPYSGYGSIQLYFTYKAA